MTYRRGWVAVFLFTLAMINYMDRIALSIAAKAVQTEFHISTIKMGYLFSSFVWSYAVFLLPMGFLIDRFGAKRLAAIGIAIWSAATVFTGLTTSFSSILFARLVMGAGESTSNPIGAKVIREWIPSSERGVITAIFNSGSYAGPALCSVFLGFLVASFGWRYSFFIAGGVGFLWLLLWSLVYQIPEKARWLGQDERDKILEERENTRDQTVEDAQADGLMSLLRTPTLWGIALTQGCNVYTQYLFLTWLPSYLQSTKNLSLAKTGYLTAVPYAAAVVLCVYAGRLSDLYLKRSGVASGARRNAVAIALLVGAVVLFVPITKSTPMLLTIFAITLTGIASTTSLNFALLNDLVPHGRDIGKAMAFVVVGGNIFGLIAPIATGYVVAATGSYNWAFAVAGLLLLVGAIVTLTMTRRPMNAAPITTR